MSTLKEAIENLEKTTEEIQKVLEELEKTVKSIAPDFTQKAKIEGSVKEARAKIKAIKEAIAEIKKIGGDLIGFLDKTYQFFKNEQSVLGRM